MLEALKPRFYRAWNHEIFPDCIVIAIDERDPEDLGYTIAPSEREPYLFDQRLLQDPHYVRTQRLRWERHFSADPTFFPVFLERSIHLAQTTPVKPEEQEKRTRFLHTFEAILIDVRAEPKADIYRRN